MGAICIRLKEERKRLGFSQEEFALLAGITRRPYAEWEGGNTFPNAAQLAALFESGADVQYIVTGVRSDVALTPDEQELVSLFRAASLSVKAAAIGALQGGTAPSGAKISIGGKVHGQVVEGGLVNNAPMNIGTTKTKKK